MRQYYDYRNRCNACNRPLKDPTAEFGPVCAERQHLISNVLIRRNMDEFNPNVKVLQEQLNKLHYTGKNGSPLEVDGLYGPETLSAILEYKIKNRLYDKETTEYPMVTEDVDVETWRSIFDGTLITPIPNGQDQSRFFSYNPDVYDEKVEKIQNFLRNKGYEGATREPLEATGHYDFDTCMAVNFFKLDNDIKDDGMIGVVTNEVYDLIFPEEVPVRETRELIEQVLSSYRYSKFLERYAKQQNNQDIAIWNDYGEIIGYNPNGDGYTIHGEAGTKIHGGAERANVPLTFEVSEDNWESILADKVIQRLMTRHDVNQKTAREMYDEDVQNGTNRHGTFDGRSLLEQKGDIHQYSGDKFTANPLIYRKGSTDYRIDDLVERGNISDYNLTPVAALQKDPNDIRVIQAYLRESGYYKGKFDGYGQETEKAVKAFQKQAELAQDGDVGTDTYGAMGFHYVLQADDNEYHPVEDETYKKYLALADWYEQYDAGNATEHINAKIQNIAHAPEAFANKRIALNWEDNSKYVFDDYIYGQGSFPTNRLIIGHHNNSWNACGVVAVYNGLKLLGNYNSPANIIAFVENGGYLDGIPGIAEGLTGIKAEGIEKCFSEDFGYTTIMAKKPNNCDDLIKNADVAVMRFRWHDGLRLGDHYIAIKWSGEQFEVYNEYNNSTTKKSYDSIDDWAKENGHEVQNIISVSY